MIQFSADAGDGVAPGTRRGGQQGQQPRCHRVGFAKTHAVIGGTITSTILTLLVIPTFYEIIDGVRERVKGMFSR
mgnify:CR=1 FL=1